MSSTQSVKALFLDRDGVINIDNGYVFERQNFEFMPGIFDLGRVAMRKDYKIFVITNQSGIARGKYTEQDFFSMTEWMNQEFSKEDVTISQVYFCPHHPEYSSIENKNCTCRKPKPGLLLKASRDHGINLSQSLMVGDKMTDMQAAQAAGVRSRLLLTSISLNAEINTASASYKSVQSLGEIAHFL